MRDNCQLRTFRYITIEFTHDMSPRTIPAEDESALRLGFGDYSSFQNQVFIKREAWQVRELNLILIFCNCKNLVTRLNACVHWRVDYNCFIFCAKSQHC